MKQRPFLVLLALLCADPHYAVSPLPPSLSLLSAPCSPLALTHSALSARAFAQTRSEIRNPVKISLVQTGWFYAANPLDGRAVVRAALEQTGAEGISRIRDREIDEILTDPTAATVTRVVQSRRVTLRAGQALEISAQALPYRLSPSPKDEQVQSSDPSLEEPTLAIYRDYLSTLEAFFDAGEHLSKAFVANRFADFEQRVSRFVNRSASQLGQPRTQWLREGLRKTRQEIQHGEGPADWQDTWAKALLYLNRALFLPYANHLIIYRTQGSEVFLEEGKPLAWERLEVFGQDLYVVLWPHHARTGLKADEQLVVLDVANLRMIGESVLAHARRAGWPEGEAAILARMVRQTLHEELGHVQDYFWHKGAGASALVRKASSLHQWLESHPSSPWKALNDVLEIAALFRHFAFAQTPLDRRYALLVLATADQSPNHAEAVRFLRKRWADLLGPGWKQKMNDMPLAELRARASALYHEDLVAPLAGDLLPQAMPGQDTVTDASVINEWVQKISHELLPPSEKPLRRLLPFPLFDANSELRKGYEGASIPFPENPVFPEILENLKNWKIYRHASFAQVLDLTQHAVPQGTRIQMMGPRGSRANSFYTIRRSLEAGPLHLLALDEKDDLGFGWTQTVGKLSDSGPDMVSEGILMPENSLLLMEYLIEAIRTYGGNPEKVLGPYAWIAFESRNHAFQEETIFGQTASGQPTATIIIDRIIMLSQMGIKGALFEAAAWLTYGKDTDQQELTSRVLIALMRKFSVPIFVDIYGNVAVRAGMTIRQWMEARPATRTWMDEESSESGGHRPLWVNDDVFTAAIHQMVGEILEFIDATFPGSRQAPDGSLRRLLPFPSSLLTPPPSPSQARKLHSAA